MNADGQHERQRIGQAKCQRIDHRTPAITSGVPGGNSVLDESSSRILVDTRRIKKERNCVQITNENGNDNANDNSAAGSSENGHQNSRGPGNNNMCRNISNGFHSREVLQEVIAAKWGQSAHGADNTSKNDKLRLMIEDSLSEESKNRVQEIFVQVEQLKTEEKFLLYLRLPACLTNSGGGVDPLKQPLNPLGNRYEIQQTIMWIKTHLEEDPDVSLPKQEVYDEYNVFCIRNSMKPLSTADFGKVMKQVYPRVRPRRLGTRGNSRYCYAGMRKRIKLDTPTLPAVTDSVEPDEFDEPITEEMLGAASILIREWAESLLKMKFSSLSALARHLVDNLRVDSRSLAAVCILSASADGQSSSNNKVSETSPSLSVTPVAGKPGKMREAQLQLQRKLQQREHSRDQKLLTHATGKEKPSESPTTPTPTIARSSSSIGRGCKKSKTGPSPHCPTAILATGPSPRSSSQPAATVSPARTRKLPRSSSQAASPQLNCDNTSNSKKEIDAVSSRCWTPNESVQTKNPTKNTRKRASLELTRQSTETSPEKQAKFGTENSEIHNKLPSPRKPDKITVVIPDCPASLKICKTEQVAKKIAKTKELDKITNGRFQDNRLDDKLCTIDPDALDDYLNGGNNSQEQEEELLQYFQQSGGSSSEPEATTASNVLTNLEAEQTSRSDKVSQLRLILQQNLKATARPENSVETETTATLGAGRETPIVEIKTPASNKQHNIVLPILLNHHTNHTSGTRRRVSFETSVIEQQVSQTGAVSHSAHGTVPQSPNTRRRTFNFTPISPGPHSPINGRPATQASKPNSANVSPFVSPRNTPVPRSRSNLQGGISRSRGNQKSLARSISCSVPYTTMRNETFVVPTSNADNTRLVITSVGNLNCPKNTAQVQVGGNISSRLLSGESNEEHKVLPAGCSVQFLSGADLNPQKQLLINYPSQENLQEIKNVYGNVDTTSGHLSRNSQPADQEISELLNGVAVKQQSFTTEQLFYRSQSVPLHRMVNPTLMSPIGTIQQYLTGLNPQSFNNSSNSSIAPTPVPSEFNDFGTIGGDAYLLDDVDTGFIADDQQFFMEDKESINKILNILDQEGRQLRNMENVATEENVIDGGLSIPLLEANIQPDVILDPAAVLDPSVGLEKIIESRSYPNTPLPIVANNNYTGHGFTEDNSNGSRSYPSTPLHTIAQQDVYRESNEPMLSSPTLNSLNLRNDNGDTVVVESVSRNVADLLETNFLADNEADPDDLGTLGNFDGLQDVDSLAPLFNEVTDNNNR